MITTNQVFYWGSNCCLSIWERLIHFQTIWWPSFYSQNDFNKWTIFETTANIPRSVRLSKFTPKVRLCNAQRMCDTFIKDSSSWTTNCHLFQRGVYTQWTAVYLAKTNKSAQTPQTSCQTAVKSWWGLLLPKYSTVKCEATCLTAEAWIKLDKSSWTQQRILRGLKKIKV